MEAKLEVEPRTGDGFLARLARDGKTIYAALAILVAVFSAGGAAAVLRSRWETSAHAKEQAELQVLEDKKQWKAIGDDERETAELKGTLSLMREDQSHILRTVDQIYDRLSRQQRGR